MHVCECMCKHTHKKAKEQRQCFRERREVLVSDEAFSGGVNSKENRVVIGCICRCMHHILLNDKMEQAGERKKERREEY